MELLTKIKLIIFVVLIAELVACGSIEEKPKETTREKMITEAKALDYISRTYESAYIQGAQDVLDKWIEREKSGKPTTLDFQYYMDLKNKRLKAFLAGN